MSGVQPHPTLPLAECLVADRLWAQSRLERIARLPAVQAEAATSEVGVRLQESVREVQRRSRLPLTLSYPENLPITAQREAIQAVIRSHRCFVLTGETGSGKTTQLPKLLLEAGYGRRGMIAVTQPRRVAAFAIAARLRSETQAAEGVVAHSVRFNDQATADTVLRIMTDGLLLAELERDPLLSRYDAVMIDEAHERSLTIDLLLGLVRRLRERRPELLMAVSSASIEAERFAAYLGGGVQAVPVIAVSGRTFPVTIQWRPPQDQADEVGYLQGAIQAIKEVHASPERGDVLCFLPTERDILEAARRLRDLPGAEVMPLFSRLTPGEQGRIFASCRGRKIVLSTNIAETSLTIPGICFVIDSGLARIKRYHPSSRTERLPIEPISQASCLQRAGRAGRIEAGTCIRLYAEEDFSAREAFASPEIMRSNLAGVVLSCLASGITHPEEFPWLDAPQSQAWREARLLLEELGALTAVSDSTLSAIGRAMAGIPTDPQVARILISGITEGVAHEACTIAAFLSIQDPRVRPLGLEAKADAAHRAFAHEAGDLATILNLWDAYQAATSNSARSRLCDSHFLGYRRMREFSDVRHQLWSSLRSSPSAKGALPAHGFASGSWPLDRIHRCVLTGMLGNVLMYDRQERAYRAGGDRLLQVHPGSALRSGKMDDGKRAPPPPPWLVACEVVETSRLFARLCAPIDPEWVVALAGTRVKRRHRQPHFHRQRQQVVCTETITWKGLPVRDGRLVPYERVDARAATLIFIREALLADEPLGGRGGGPGGALGLEVIAENRQTVASAERLMHRLRDPAAAPDPAALERFYVERLGPGRDAADARAAPASSPAPARVETAAPGFTAMASSDALRRRLRAEPPGFLRLDPTSLIPQAVAERAQRDYPEVVQIGRLQKPLSYRFHPGADDDGATLELTQADLAQVAPSSLGWLIPGWIPERIEAYCESLPKEQRRSLTPLAKSVEQLSATLRELVAPGGPPRELPVFEEALATALRDGFGVRAAPLDPQLVPPHLRLRLRVRESDGSVSYCGREWTPLEAQATTSPERLARLRARWQTMPDRAWPGDCPGAVSLEGVTGFVALERSRDQTGTVAARRTVYATAEAGSCWHEDGLDALLEAALAQPLEVLALGPASAGLTACEATLGLRLGAARRQLGVCLLTSGAQRHLTSRVTDAQGWEDLHGRSRQALTEAGGRIDALLRGIITQAQALRTQLKRGLPTLAALPVLRCVEDGVSRLLSPGWPQRLPWSTILALEGTLATYAALLRSAAGNADAPRRLAARATEVVAAWDEAMAGDGRRYAQALGQGRLVRSLSGELEGCVEALLGSHSASGLRASQFLARVRTLQSELVRARAQMHQARQELIDIRPVLARHPASRRAALQQVLDRTIAGLPDLSLGADLGLQMVQATALVARIRSPGDAAPRAG
jgi:ATP-dependent helicase HrpA